MQRNRKKVFFQILAKISQEAQQINHKFIVLVKQIYTTKSVQHKWHFYLWWTFSSKNTFLFIFTHFWWKNSSQTEEHVIKYFSGLLSSKFQRRLQITFIFVMYDFHLFKRFVIFGNCLQLF